MMWSKHILKTYTKWGDLVHDDGTVSCTTSYTFPPECMKDAWQFKVRNDISGSINIERDFMDRDKILQIVVNEDCYKPVEQHPLMNEYPARSEIVEGEEE